MSENTGIKRTPRPARKPKKSQIPVALLLTVVVVAIGFWFATKSAKLPLFWMFGLAFGYVLQRSRFCFTAGFRDPIITGGTSVSRAILVAFGIGTIGISAIKYASVLNDGNPAIQMQGVESIGLPLILGAIIFGIGMVIAGGCASGTLMRVGEGFQMQWLSLVFFVAGSTWGAHDMGAFWSKFNEGAPKIFLPDVFGWFGALVVQALIIILLYIAARKWQEKKMGTAE